MPRHLSVLILAGGEGTRMKSSLPKVLHRLCGVPLLRRVLDTVSRISPGSLGIVVGHGSEKIRKAVKAPAGARWILQREQRGTGHAVQCASSWIRSLRASSDLLLVPGDAPLIRRETLLSLAAFHRKNSNDATVLTVFLADPRGYGRIVRDPFRNVIRIVEERDASDEDKKIREVNTGLYCFRAGLLLKALPGLKPYNAQKEFYLTDVIEQFCRRGLRVKSFCPDPEPSGALAGECSGINSRADLAECEKILQGKILRSWMLGGVTILNPAGTYIGGEVSIGPDTTLLPGTHLLGNTRIGKGCVIGPNTLVEDSFVSDGASIRSSYVYGSRIGAGAKIGPFSHLRPGSEIGPGARIGNFTEVKNSRVGRETKVSHLSYIGDASLGEEINVGAGVITCNFDGRAKHRTVIGSGSFIGSNVNLIAPVKIGKGSLVGAGSTISRDVPKNSLAIERSQQVIKKDWMKKKRQKENHTKS